MAYSLVEQILKNFDELPERTAFHIQELDYSYGDLKLEVIKIAKLISNSISESERVIGILSFDDLFTYASILACWTCGKAYVPLNPDSPLSRNRDIISDSGLQSILASQGVEETKMKFPGLHFQDTSRKISDNQEFEPVIPGSSSLAYILFTSGSTGKPKGVSISHGNLNSFIYHFIHSGYNLSYEDKFLQIYDLSFDASVHCFSVPLSLGASVYTVPPNEIKYLYAYKLMRDYNLSFVKMPPSTLAYLKPYFKKIKLDSLRYCLLGGEAFSSQLAGEWEACVPNALIQNVYGPTELTVNCMIYNWQDSRKDYLGVVSIGKSFGENETIILDEENNIIEDESKGELCVSGKQVTPGYWNNEENNLTAFLNIEKDGLVKKYYKTGDVVFRDQDGDLMYCGRIDSQIQVQGYRVELGEVEEHSREFLNLTNLAAVGVENVNGTTEIKLFTEGAAAKVKELRLYLIDKLPKYMIPAEIIDLDSLPKTAGGKIDRSKLKEIAAQ